MNFYEYHDVNFRGRIERITYNTTNKDGDYRDKYALVYLPKGYDASDMDKRYNVLYLMHGGGGSPDAWLDCCKVKNMLDHSIDTGLFEPLIVVFPTFYKEKISRIGKADPVAERFNTEFFQKELAEELIPAVEGRFNTYARSVTPAGLKESRKHRAFGGFSMGGCTTWYAFIHNMDVIANFLPLSGDCWAIEPLGGGSKTKETAAYIHESVLRSGYGKEDYKIYAATGSEDLANTALTPLIKELQTYEDIFTYSDDFTQGNLHFFVEEGQKHEYEAVMQYAYNYLPYLFKD